MSVPDSATPTAAPAEPELGPSTSQNLNDYQRAKKGRAERLRTIFSTLAPTEEGPLDKEAGVLALAKETGMSTDMARSIYPEVARTRRAGAVDPETWDRVNPHLADMMLRRDELAPTILADKPLNALQRSFGWYMDLFDSRLPRLEVLEASRAQLGDSWSTLDAFGVGPGAMLDAKIARRKAFDARQGPPQKEVLTEDAQAKELRERGPFTIVGGGFVVPTAAIVAGYRFTEKWQQQKKARSYLEWAIATERADALRALGDIPGAAGADARATWLMQEAHDIDHDAVRRNYQEGEVGKVLGTIAEGAASTLVGTQKGIEFGTAAAAVAGGATYAVTRSPTLAGEAAVKFGSGGLKLGAAYGTFEQEFGSSLEALLKTKTESGQPLSPRTARVAALVYATIASGVEFASFGPMLSAFGPIGEVVKNGETKAFAKALLKTPSFRSALSEAAKHWGLAGLSEGGEEFLQDGFEQAVNYAARSITAGHFESKGVELGQSAEAGWEGAIGGWGLAGMGTATHLVTAQMAIDQAHANAKLIEDVTSLAESKTARAAPTEVAQMVVDHAAAGGKDATAMHLDPGPMVRLFQEANLDVNEAATALLGPAGPQRLQQALATGGRLVVPMAEYLQKIGPTALGEAMAPHTSLSATAPTMAQVEGWGEAVKEAAKGIETAPAETEGEQAYLDATEAQLADVQDEGKANARKQVSIVRAAIRTMQARLGADANSIFQGLALEVVRGDEQASVGGQRLEQGQQDHEASVALSHRAESLSPEERARELFIDPVSGMRNLRGYEASRRAPGSMVGVITVLDAKAINDDVQGGHDTTNSLLRHVGRAVAAASPEAARHGTNFLVDVKSDAHLQQLLEQVRAALPDKSLSVEGALGFSRDKAFEKLDAATEAKRKAGQLPARGKTNVDLTQLPALEQRFATEGVNTALPAALAERAAALTPAEHFAQAYLDQAMPGVLSKTGFDAVGEKAFVVSLDLAGLKLVNGAFGKAAGDKLLATFARIAMDAGGGALSFAHLSGDEFALKSDDKAALEEFLRDLSDGLQSSGGGVFAEHQGKTYILRPEFRAGIGEKTYGQADRALNTAKRAEAHRDVAREVSRDGGRIGREGKAGRDAVSRSSDLEGRRARAGARGVQPQAFVDRQAARSAVEARAVAEGVRPGAVEDVSFDTAAFDKAAALEGVTEARGWVSRMRSAERAAMATALLDFYEGKGERPKPPTIGTGEEQAKFRKLYDDLAQHMQDAFGLVDPETGATFDESGRSMERTLAGKKKKGRAAVPDSLAENKHNQGGAWWMRYQSKGPKKGRLEQSKKVTETEPFKKWFGASKVVDAGGQPKVVFHGSQRPDRIGDRFQKSRATSGPSAFFTDDPAIASSYSTNKNDTSIDIPTDYSGWFKMKVGKSTVDLDKAWLHLTPEQREEIRSKLPHVVHPGEDRSKYALDEAEYGLAGESHWAHEIRAAHGNVLKAAKEIWLNGGELVDSEEEFMQVLDLGGAKGLFEFHDPHATNAGVIPVYLSIASPLVTSKITAEDVAALEKASKRQREPAHNRGVDQWDKRSQSPSAWIQRLKEDLESGTSSHAWTSIPDWVTKTLKSRGYDGIHDVGGKNGGTEHSVWIPFEPKQIKSATGNRGTFDPNDPSILRSDSTTPGGAPRGYTNLDLTGETQKLFTIALNKDADLSTFLHESGHIFLKLFSMAASDPAAPLQVKEDFATALKWLGAESFEKLTREQHEQWATGFERYLREGKAPSAKLVGAFEAFRLWLTDIYRGITGAARLADINDEIRGVFDRLLATDAEIQQQRNAMGIGVPMAADLLGMNPVEYLAYLDKRKELDNTTALRAAHAAMKDQLREKEAWWKEAYAKELKAAEAEYESLPARMAQQTLLGKGEVWGGTTTHVVLQRDEVLAAVGPELAKKFRTAVDGVSADEIVELFPTFKTGAAMLDAIASLPEKEVWAKGFAQQQMAEKHPGLLDDRIRLQQLIGEGLHGAMTEHLLARESAALVVRVPGAVQVPDDVIRATAQELVSERLVNRLDPAASLNAERAAANEAVRAAAAGNFRAALLAKNKQRLNMHVWRELNEARKDRDDLLKLADKLSTRAGRERLGKGHPTYLGGSDLILETLGLKEKSPREEPLPSLGEVVQQLMADDADPGFDEAVVSKALAGALAVADVSSTLKPWQHLTVAEMRQVLGALLNIKAAAKNRATFEHDGKRIAIETAEIELVADARKNLPAQAPPPTRGAETVPQDLSRRWNSFDGSMRKPEFMLNRLGGRTIESPWFQYITRPLQRAKHSEADLLKRFAPSIIEAFRKMPSKRAMEMIDGRDLLPSHRNDVAVPQRRFEWLLLLLNAGNQSNLDRLTEGRGITEQQIRDGSLKLGITKEEYDWVQAVIDTYEELGHLSFDLDEEMTGLRPEKIEAKEFVTPFGKYKGGYFPAVYDPDVTSVGKRQDEASFMDKSYVRPGTSRAHLKSRVPGFSDVISLGTSTISKHLVQVVHDLAYRKAIKSTSTLLMRPAVQAVLRERLGVAKANTFEQWLRDVGQQRGNDGDVRVAEAMKVVRWAKGNLPMVALGYSLQNALEDFTTNITAALPGSGFQAQHFAAGLSEVTTRGVAAMNLAEQQSGELRARRDQIHRDFVRKVAELTQRDLPGRAQVRFLKEHAFVFTEMVDRFSSTAIWLGAQRQYQVEHADDANTEKVQRDGVLFADAMVRQLMLSHSVVDSSAIMRDKGYLGTFLTFFGYFNHAYNRAADIVDQGIDAKTFTDRAKKAGALLGFMFASSVISSVVRGQGPGPGDEPEDEDEHSWRALKKWRNFTMRKLLVGTAELFPFLGSGAQAVEAGYLGQKQVGVRNNSVVGLAEDMAKSALKAKNPDVALDERIKAGLRVAATMTGLPIPQLLKMAGYIWDVAEGEAHPRGPLDVVGGLVHGRRREANLFTIAQDLAQGVPPGTGPQ